MRQMQKRSETQPLEGIAIKRTLVFSHLEIEGDCLLVSWPAGNLCFGGTQVIGVAGEAEQPLTGGQSRPLMSLNQEDPLMGLVKDGEVYYQ